MSYVLIMHHIYIRSTVSALEDLFWVLLQLQIYRFSSSGDLLRSCVVEWLGFCAEQHPRGNCVCFESKRVFFLVKLHILNTAHSDSTVSEEVLSILLCAHRELFPLSFQSKSRVGRRLALDAHSWLLTHPLVCFYREPDRPIHRLLVLNNDMQLLRMSMSFPVFVRSYLVLLWKPNVILNSTPAPLCFCLWLPRFQKKNCLCGRVRPHLQR